MDVLKDVWQFGTHPTLDAIMLTFNESLEFSKLRRFIVDKCVWESSSEVLMMDGGAREAMLPGFGLDLSMALTKRIESGVPATQHDVCFSALFPSGQAEHRCKCHTNFREISPSSEICPITLQLDRALNRDSLGSGRIMRNLDSREHACERCGLHFESWLHSQKGRPGIVLGTEAPYVRQFCAEYHEHLEGLMCKNDGPRLHTRLPPPPPTVAQFRSLAS